MSNQYIYSGDQAIIIQDGAIIWNDQSHEQSSINYFDANDSVINDSTINESYVTAIDANETQYLSILEHSNSNEITLEGLHNLTVENGDVSGVIHSNNITPRLSAEIEEENNEESDTQVIVFTLEGSDDLYGIQLTHDEAGNVQKYQFKFRPTSDGQLEPIPETVTLLPNDNQIAVDTLEDKLGQTEEIERPQNQGYFLVQTSLESDNCIDKNVQNSGQVDGAHVEHVYIKECHSPVVAEEITETENVDPEILQHCIDTVAQDTHLERHLKNLCIKTELVERAEEDIQSPISSQFNIKQEKYFGTESEEGHEDDIFEEAIQNDSISKEDLINIQQQQEENYPDNEIQIYQQSDEASSEPPEESHDEEFLASVEHQRNHEQLLQHFINENSQIEVQYETELDAPERPLDECEYNEVYDSEEHHTDYGGDYLQQTMGSVNHATETGEYQISESYVGGPAEAEEAPVVSNSVDTALAESYQEPIVQRSSILKRSLANSEKEEKSRKPLVSVKYYVVYPEKENVNSLAGDNTSHSQLSIPKLTRSNPRSVLRTSFLRQKEKHQKLATNVLPECDLYHKRFAKNKDAMRAKHFHNFLNRTTIPHAPVRQQRQPRKQEIKPVIERSDEEIIVQEVIVSSSGFIESINKKVRNKKVQVTAVVELSDSEDDSNAKVKRNRRKTHHLLRNPSESDISIIEIHSDNEEPDIPRNIETNVKIHNFKKTKIRSSPVTLKRRRGRPPKNKKDCFELPLPDVELSPSKRSRTDTVVPQCDNIVTITSATNIDKKEITCPFCPKTFPSQNSLNTHIIHHNLENSLKKKAKMSLRPNFVPRQSLLPKLEYNHKCDECQESFKNIILLQKHNCTKKQTSLNCSVCLKQFRDVTLLNIHKKSHAKSNLVKNTSILKISPKKILHRPSTSLMKSSIAKSPKLVTRSFKCTECPKVCDSEQRLITHTKMHKKFVCSSCFLTFSSKILLDTHVRTNCVKLKAGNKRLSFTIRKSFIHTPPRRLSISQATKEKCLTNTMNSSLLSAKLDCDQCTMKFSTFRNLYIHKVQKHGLNTPDKSLMTKPKPGIYKPRPAHGGIPTNDRLKKSYAALRKKIAETEDLIL